tara:strand:- start:80726 stop:81661 length:936 start_codon:yes stop_codon:yes gene_type:complete
MDLHDVYLHPAPDAALEMAKHLTETTPGVAGVLFYGSGLWKAIEDDTVLDFYLLVDSYSAAQLPLSHRFWGTLLPPNVYYKEFETADGQKLRCKYAVMTMRQFSMSAHGISIAPSIWARFSQPCRILHPRSKADQDHIIETLYSAVRTFHRRTLPLLKEYTTVENLWVTGLKDTYACELRSESKSRGASIYEANKEYYDKATAAFAAATLELNPLEHQPDPDEFMYHVHIAKGYRTLKRLNTPIRRFFGKLVTFFRLMKAPLTFTGAVDYIVWKIERHSGHKITPTDRQRKYPLIFAWPLVYKVLTNKIAK